MSFDMTGIILGGLVILLAGLSVLWIVLYSWPHQSSTGDAP